MKGEVVSVPIETLQRFLSMLDTDEHKGDIGRSISWFVKKMDWPQLEWCYVHEHLMFPWDEPDWDDEPCVAEK